MRNKIAVFFLLMFALPLVVFVYIQHVRSLTSVSIAQIGQIDTVEVNSTPEVPIHAKQQPARIGFVGDVLLARHVEYHMDTQGADYPFRHIKHIFPPLDALVGNFESAVLQNHVKTPSFVTRFSVDTQYLSQLSAASFTHVSLANNHSFDYGASTYAHTVETLTGASIVPFGHPQLVGSSSVTTIPAGDYTVGIVGLNQVFVTVSLADVRDQFATIASSTDYQIAYVHWGDEYILKHNITQETLAKKLIDIGFDAVIGHHPHVTQDIQVYNDKPIFYSLGNFIFDQYFSVDVQQGLALVLELSSSSASYEIIPVSSEGSRSQPYAMAENEARLFLKNLARRSDAVYVHNIEEGKLILPYTLATSP